MTTTAVEADGLSNPAPPAKAPAVPKQEPAAHAAPTADRPGRAARPWRGSLLAALPVWTTAYVAWVAVTYLAWAVLSRPESSSPSVAELLPTSWQRYDFQRFVTIAQDGYATDQSPAFFPLYPLLIRGLDPVLPGGPFLAALVLSAAALLGALVMLHRLVDSEWGADVARRAIWLLMAFPTAYYLGLGYNTSLFLGFSVACLYLVRRGHWWAAGAVGGLATLTRSGGVLLGAVFAYEYLRVRGFRPSAIRWNALAVLLIPAGLAVYAAYLWSARGDALAFVHAQGEWSRSLDWPWTSLVNTVEYLGNRPRYTGLHVLAFLDPVVLLITVALLVACFVGPWRMRRDQLVFPLYGVLLVLFMISFPPDPNLRHPLMSVSRLSLEVIPIFIVLARIRWLRHPYTHIALVVQAALLIHFSRGGWVA